MRRDRCSRSREYASLATDAFNRRLATGAEDPHTRYYLAALFALQDDVEPVLQHLAAPLAQLGAFTRWRLPRDPDFAGVLANPAVTAHLAAAET